jgi:flagellar hook-associated protein 1
MTSGLFGIGTSGLLAFQRALGVTSHNIANSATEGYSRQRIELSARTPQYYGNGYFGTGVQVDGVQRLFDQFVINQLRSSTSGSHYHDLYYDFARRVDNLLADTDTGLASGLQQFFAAVQDVANDPTSTPARQVLISEAESLVDRFWSLNQRLEEQRSLINGQISSSVAEINSLAQGIADLNEQIVVALGRGAGSQPNDLLDQRDQLVLKLSELVSVHTVEQDDGALNVFVGNGQNLVMGNHATTLVAEALGPDPRETHVGVAGPAGTMDITRHMTGGQLGALLDLRTSVVDKAQNALGLTAIGLAEAFNEQHRLGQDLNGALGEDFFRLPDPELIARTGNSVTGEPQVTIDDYRLLTTDDYLIRFNGSDWELRREPGGQVLDSAPPGGSLTLGTAPDTAFTVDLSTLGGAAAAGDSFLLRPTRQAAAQIDTVISDPRLIAAASPVRATADDANAGSAVVRSVVAVDRDTLDLSSVTVTYDAGASAFQIGGESFALDPSGVTEIEYNGWRLTIEGEPTDGDSFTVGPNTGGVGDNSNALALAGLQDARVLLGGTATLEGSYGNLVAEVGTRTRQAEIAASAQAKLLADAQAQREAISGVNLDEEAANLLRYQQAYQAAAQVIAVTNSLFETLITAVRR